MDTLIDFEDPYPYFGGTVPASEPEPEPMALVEPIEEIEMAKKAQELCPTCGSDNLYLDALEKKEWGYDASILGDREYVKKFTRVTCLACGEVYDKPE